MKRILCALLSFVLLITLFPFSYAVADDNLSFEDDPKAIQTASNSVIMLSCYDKNGNLYSTGSAFAAFEEGVFVTNYHVIEKEVYSIRASMESGLEFRITSVVAYDKDKDIAILRTEAKTGLAPLPIGSTAALERGEKVIAIGSPLGLINTLSIGLYSGTLKDDQVYLQFSAPISHGSSGGALFNNRGEVVGITSASFTEGQNLNLAIPIEEVVKLWDKRDTTKELSIPEFYEEWKHLNPYTVSYMLTHKTEFSGQTIVVEGYVFIDSSKSDWIYLVDSSQDVTSLRSALTKTGYGSSTNYSSTSSPAMRTYTQLLEKKALLVYMDSSLVSQGDFIRVQADAATYKLLKNAVIID